MLITLSYIICADLCINPINFHSCSDQGLVNDSGTGGLYYKAGDEPEPIDLTHLNVEAAMMCLASKVRLLCGKANSPTLSARYGFQ